MLEGSWDVGSKAICTLRGCMKDVHKAGAVGFSSGMLGFRVYLKDHQTLFVGS